ncbi:MAG: UDP-glucose/GDP-mannose dehydrogenase family protein [Chlamydiota bacterium]
MSPLRLLTAVFLPLFISLSAAPSFPEPLEHKNSSMHLLVIGTGYVGLVTGACFAEMGHHVICLDIDTNKIERLKQGIIPIFEPGLEEIIKRNTQAGRLVFTTNYKDSLKNSLACFIAVPTPSDENGSCDISYVLSAATEIAKHMDGYKLIVNKSTIPIGTGTLVQQRIEQILKERDVDYAFDMVSNPEFLKEGTAVSDCLNPDRIILGVNNPTAASLMKEIYSSFTLTPDRIIIMDVPSAEMTKYAANAMLASRISFMNELAGLCEILGANINNVRIGIGADRRIGKHFLFPGIGFGGSCFPKDIQALQAMAKAVNYDVPLLKAIETINVRQKTVLAKKIHNYFNNVQGKTIALLGLSFKPDTDDMREAPSLQIIAELLAKGAILRLYDPIAMEKAAHFLPKNPNLIFCQSEYEAATGADALAILTEWKQFRFIDFEKIQSAMKGKAIFDGRNLYQSQELRDKGFDYFGIGVP